MYIVPRTSGFVYFFRLHVYPDPWACPYKIGKSISVPKRESQLGIMLPYPIELVHCIHSPNMHNLERYIHSMFAEFHMRGEWFSLSREAVEWLKERWTQDKLAELGQTLRQLRKA